MAGTNQIDIDVTERFHKGVAISIWQNSGDDNLSNWTQYVHQKWPFKYFGVKTFQGRHSIGKSNDFWDRYEEDLELARQLGTTAFRFSFEWARIEPTRGQIDQNAIKRYHEMLDVMERMGMEPNVTLHHFTHPAWFQDLGAWQKEENIQLFVDWSVMMFKEFAPRIKMWATFNEPTCYSFLGFIVAMMPPGHIFQLGLSGRVLLNMLKAHVLTYKALKPLPGGKEAMIGLVHHHITFKPRCNTWPYALAGWVAKWGQYWWGWDVVDHWMHTGEYVWKVPFFGEWIRFQEPEGKPPCDWWGINYYSRVVLDWNLTSTCMEEEVMTDMYYPIYPDGMYQAIKRSSKYNIPMYITETGCPDARDDRRHLMIDQYMKAVLKGMADGYDIRGLYYWTLMDNFEWATGFTMRFGLYHWEADGSVDRKLREGAKALVHYFKTLPDDLRGVIAAAKKDYPELTSKLQGADPQPEEGDFVLVDKNKNRGSNDGALAAELRKRASTVQAEQATMEDKLKPLVNAH